MRDGKEVLLDLLQESYDRFAWHGPNLTQALRGVNAEQANWRPPRAGPVVWNIREIVLHVAGIMQECGASLLARDRERRTTVNEESFPLPDLRDDEEWSGEIDLLQQSYDLMRTGLSALTPAMLQQLSPSRAYDRDWSVMNHVYGIAFHNIYHAAQIVSLRKQQNTWTELA